MLITWAPSFPRMAPAADGLVIEAYSCSADFPTMIIIFLDRDKDFMYLIVSC